MSIASGGPVPEVQKHISAADEAIASNRPQSAIEPLLAVVKIQPHEAKHWIRLGEVLFEMGHLDQASGCFCRALALRPGEPWALTGLALVYERRGELEEARGLLECLVEAPNAHVNAVTIWATVSRRLGQPETAAATLQRALSEPRPPVERVVLHYVLGECLDALGRHSDAFDAYRSANELRDRNYDPESHEYDVDCMIEAFDADSFLRRPSATHGDGRIVLLVGMMRCGSTLVEQILDCHPDVYAAGEVCMLELVPKMIGQRTGSGLNWYRSISELSAASMDELGASYLEVLERQAGSKRRIIDKTLPNYFLLGLAGLMIPDVRVIHCTRDPVDTCLSCYFTNFRAPHPYTTRLDWLGHRYRQYIRLMSHWDRVLPVPVHTVRYESLVARPEPEIRGLLAFLDLPWSDACLNPERAKRVAQTASYHQVKQAIHSRSVGRARAYAKWLGALFESLGDLSSH